MAQAWFYRFFDLCIRSELELPAPSGGAGRSPDWTVKMGSAGREEQQWFHTWNAPDGRALMSVAGDGEKYILGFPGVAQFSIDFGRRHIAAHALGRCTPETLAHLLLDQVLARVVCHQGRMVLHASAVALPDGAAIAFTGASGRGKSTLASAFYRAGYRLLSDDCLLLEERAGKAHAIPAYPSMRLWPDAADALFSMEEQHRLHASRMAHYADKRVLQPGAPADAGRPFPLRALYLLEASDAVAGPDTIRIEPVRGMASIMALVEAQFTLDVAGREAMQRSFRAVQAVVRGTVLFRLGIPRRYDILPRVVETIAASG